MLELWKNFGDSKEMSVKDLMKAVKTGFEIYAEVMDVYDYHHPLTAEKARKITNEKWVSLVSLKNLLDDFGDLAEYDNDDVISLVNGLKKLVEVSTWPLKI
jgi:hypothetical protein